MCLLPLLHDLTHRDAAAKHTAQLGGTAADLCCCLGRGEAVFRRTDPNVTPLAFVNSLSLSCSLPHTQHMMGSGDFSLKDEQGRSLVSGWARDGVLAVIERAGGS